MVSTLQPKLSHLQELSPATRIGWLGIRIEDFNTIIWSNVETIAGQAVPRLLINFCLFLQADNWLGFN